MDKGGELIPALLCLWFKYLQSDSAGGFALGGEFF